MTSEILRRMAMAGKTAVAARERGNLLAEFQAMALKIALAENGNGEDPMLGNNRGKHVDRYRAGDGVEGARLGQSKTGGSGSWCATFGSWCDLEAVRQLGIVCPHLTYRGAKALVKAVAKSGRWVARNDIELMGGEGGKLAFFGRDGEPLPNDAPIVIPSGAWMALNRGTAVNPRLGHFVRVIDHALGSDTLHVVDGNGPPNRPLKGGSPPKGARVAKWSVVGPRWYPRGAWRRDCAGIASYV